MGTTNLKDKKPLDSEMKEYLKEYSKGPSRTRAMRGVSAAGYTIGQTNLEKATAAAKKARSNTVGSVVSDIGKATVTSAKQVGKGLSKTGEGIGMGLGKVAVGISKAVGYGPKPKKKKK